MAPNIIVAEPTELIGTGKTSDSNYVVETIRNVNEINPDIMVLQGAGISNGQDVYNTIKLGAQATGTTSGIMKSDRPYEMVEEMSITSDSLSPAETVHTPSTSPKPSKMKISV